MIYLKNFIFLVLMSVLVSTQEIFNPPKDFDIERILDDPWYSLVWFDEAEDLSLIGCLSYQFTRPSDSNQISYEYSYNYPDIQGLLNFGIFALAPTDESRVFYVINNPIPRKFNILAYDEDYNWLVIGDTAEQGNAWIDLIVRSLDNDNTAGVTKAEEEAAMFGFGVRHDVNQSDDCQYDANREELLAEKEEQEENAQLFGSLTDFDIENMIGGIWYSLVWFNSDGDTTTYGCLSYQFIGSSNSNQISYDYIYNYPDVQGYLYYGNYTLAPTDNNHVFDVIDNLVLRKFNILAYDEGFNWIVFGDTGASLGNPWVDLIVRSLDDDNSAGVAKAEEEAAKYGFGTRHDVNHSDTCQYVDEVFGN